MSTKKGLGRGLGALLGDTALQTEENAADPARISIYKIEPNPLQPRKQFDELELQALADSITCLLYTSNQGAALFDIPMRWPTRRGPHRRVLRIFIQPTRVLRQPRPELQPFCL